LRVLSPAHGLIELVQLVARLIRQSCSAETLRSRSTSTEAMMLRSDASVLLAASSPLKIEGLDQLAFSRRLLYTSLPYLARGGQTKIDGGGH
jgi:hypothetical protein